MVYVLTEMEDRGVSNEAFGKDTPAYSDQADDSKEEDSTGNSEQVDVESGDERDTWQNPKEFLLSCISMSVGLGNVWRFPYTAYENGGLVFLIPYIIVSFLIGKPLYFMELALGQFSSSGSVKVWDVAPVLKGVGYGQAVGTMYIVTFYCAIVAITVFYLFSSFQTVLPWTVCQSDWQTEFGCYNSTSPQTGQPANETGSVSSTSLFFREDVMKAIDNIDDGIGTPDWRLSMCLLFTWICICLIMLKGIKSSGKVAYFTALFPYFGLIVLLIRGATLEGSWSGVRELLKPDWSKLWQIKTWYEAVTQCFFSLAVGSGPIIMFSSYNPFSHNIYRDAMAISLMDTFTSLLSCVTTFSILGHLAHESSQDITQVAQAGPGMAFIAFPEAIAKFTIVPQLFAFVFFLMLFTLGIGSAVAMVGSMVTIICDEFPKLKRWIVTVLLCCIGFISGLVYVTPGGLFMVDVVSYFGGGFVLFVMALVEIIGISWIYGLNRFISDVRFMLNVKLGLYWKLTLGYIIPVIMLLILVASLIDYKPLQQGDYLYPATAIGCGWFLSAFALVQIPLWATVAVCRAPGANLFKKIRNSLKPHRDWGPKRADIREQWIDANQTNLKNQSARWIPVFIPSRPMKCDSTTISPLTFRSMENL